jgi:RHS repeat-associated protein
VAVQETSAIGNQLSTIQRRYTYDSLQRLTREEIFGELNLTNDYVMDAVGNRLYRTNSLEGVTAYAYDDNDQLLTETLRSAGLQPAAVTTYGYDSNGNTTSRSNANESVTYDWDVQNRLVGARIVSLLTSAATNLVYEYDDDGIRVAAFVDGDETRYLIDANRPFAQVVEEWTSINSQPSTLNASYTHGPHHLISQSRAGARSWYHADGLGSTRALTGQSGSPTDRYHFDAYGRTLAQSGPTDNAYLYAGEQRDRNLGLDYLRARYLNFNAGRFYGRDPVEGAIQNPLRRQGYLYAHASPTDLSDPSGRWATGLGFHIHQNAIDDTLSDELDEDEREILKEQQAAIDEFQSCAAQFIHALRAPRQSKEEAKAKANIWVRTQLQLARDNEAVGRQDVALMYLGNAMHTLQDATSPSHVGFQEFQCEGLGFWFNIGRHALGDISNYPDFRSALNRETRRAYDYLNQPQPLPADFFTGPYPLPPSILSKERSIADILRPSLRFYEPPPFPPFPFL